MRNFKLLTDKYKTLTKRGKMITCFCIIMVTIIVLDCVL